MKMCGMEVCFSFFMSFLWMIWFLRRSLGKFFFVVY